MLIQLALYTSNRLNWREQNFVSIPLVSIVCELYPGIIFNDSRRWQLLLLFKISINFSKIYFSMSIKVIERRRVNCLILNIEKNNWNWSGVSSLFDRIREIIWWGWIEEHIRSKYIRWQDRKLIWYCSYFDIALSR